MFQGAVKDGGWGCVERRSVAHTSAQCDGKCRPCCLAFLEIHAARSYFPCAPAYLPCQPIHAEGAPPLAVCSGRSDGEV
jgi:hypothetical protein